MSYSSAHETSDLRSYAFKTGAPRTGRRVALQRCLRPASLSDPFSQRPERTSASHSRKSRVWLPDGAQCHPRLQREGTCCSRSWLLASQRGPRRLRRRQGRVPTADAPPASEQLRQTEHLLDACDGCRSEL